MDKLNALIDCFLKSSRANKRMLSLAYDAFALMFCIVASFSISNNSYNIAFSTYNLLIVINLVISLGIFTRIGFYQAVLRYMGLKAIFTIIAGIALSTIIFSINSYFLNFPLSSTTVFLYWSFCFIAIGGARLMVIAFIRSKSQEPLLNIAIYGAGVAGRELARGLSHSKKYKLVAYIDDEPLIFKSIIDGIQVYSPKLLNEIIQKYSIDRVLLAVPSETHSRRSEILRCLEPFPIKIKTIASMEEIISGDIQIEQLKEIEIEDLLGRDPVEPEYSLLHACITDKIVMVTGAGGSIGAELCRQIVALQPTSILLYELSEFALYSIDKELRCLIKELDLKINVIPLLGSVQNKSRIIHAMKHYRVQTVYHAAAYKHVPLVENNIIEGIRNNIFGTWSVAEAAVEANVERFVLISTDKAVRPTNIMGATKRFAELVLQAIDARGTEVIFTMVRFGNVLGSSGSVVPLFREQIKSGGPITVTHKDIIRYFMTIPEAAQLVIQAGAMGKGGDVFVLDMGDHVKISELAERMIHLYGLTVKSNKYPKGDIEINYTGLRPGEKLYEELLIGENIEGTSHPEIMTADEDLLQWNDMKNALDLMAQLCDDMDCQGIVQLLLQLPTGYSPQHELCDLLWDKKNDSQNVIRFKTFTGDYNLE